MRCLLEEEKIKHICEIERDFMVDQWTCIFTYLSIILSSTAEL